MTTWPSHIEEPSISTKLSSTYRNKQPYGKQNLLFTASFYLFQNTAMPQIQNINNTPSEKCKFWSPEPARYIPTNSVELQLTPNLEQALCQPSVST